MPLNVGYASVQVHSLHSPANIEVASALLDSMESTRDFLFAGVPAELCNFNIEPKDLVTRRRTFTQNVVRKLLCPRKNITGRVEEITLEALARNEVEEDALEQIKKVYKSINDRSEDYEAYFKLSGIYITGGRRTAQSSLILARAVNKENFLLKDTTISTCLVLGGERLASSVAAGHELRKQTKHSALGASVHNSGFRGRP